MNIEKATYCYFIGIGGIGMSALARYFHHLGKIVSGYDKTETTLTQKLIEEGILVHYKDAPEKISKKLTPKNTLVIRTPAVPTSHKELNYFKNNGFSVIKRAEALGWISKETECFAIAGTHGKTTTSSLLGHIMKASKQKASAFLGGIVQNYNSNLILGGNEKSVMEADEFDRSFLHLYPNVACITSTDADHLDIYGKSEEIEKSFQEFASLVPKDGILFVRAGIPIQGTYTYAYNDSADFKSSNARIENGNYVFDLESPFGKEEGIILNIPGLHNIENATAAIGMSLVSGISIEKIREALASFNGIQRRFNQFFFKDKIYIDDYAHHPTELNALFDSVKELYPTKKVLCLFQPHLFSRTQDFADGFAESLSKVDSLILLDIYPARELPIEGVTSDWLLEKVQSKDKKRAELLDALELVKQTDFDVLITAGAGNIDLLIDPIKNWLE